MNQATQLLRRMRRRLRYSTSAFLFYRYRYLIGFTVVGFLSLIFELVLYNAVVPKNWPSAARTVPAYAGGLVFSFLLNALFNFNVPRRYFASTFLRFSIVSTASFCANIGLVHLLRSELLISYEVSRLLCSALLFLIAYALHRRLTFQLDRNFGIAVYASPVEQVRRIFLKVGRNCDHIHVDLVDSTVNSTAQVDLKKIQLARSLWPSIPFAIHLMTRRPDKWIENTLDSIDWYLFSMGSDTPLQPLMARCQLAGKKVGVVWHCSNSLEEIYQYLPHVDFVMVLGIEKPGQSGQRITRESIAVVQMLHRLRSRYNYDLMFDGSVNPQTVSEIPARYIVAASSVLKANQPARVIYTLRTGGRHERNAA